MSKSPGASSASGGCSLPSLPRRRQGPLVWGRLIVPTPIRLIRSRVVRTAGPCIPLFRSLRLRRFLLLLQSEEFPRRLFPLILVLSFLLPVRRILAPVSRICRLLLRGRRLRSTCLSFLTRFVRRRPRLLLAGARRRPVHRRPAAGPDLREVLRRLRRHRQRLRLLRRRPRRFRAVPPRLPGPARSLLVLAAASSWRLPASLTRRCASSSSVGCSNRLPLRLVTGIPGRFLLRSSRVRPAIVNVLLGFGKPSRCVVPAGSDQAGVRIEARSPLSLLRSLCRRRRLQSPTSRASSPFRNFLPRSVVGTARPSRILALVPRNAQAGPPVLRCPLFSSSTVPAIGSFSCRTVHIGAGVRTGPRRPVFLASNARTAYWICWVSSGLLPGVRL